MTPVTCTTGVTPKKSLPNPTPQSFPWFSSRSFTVFARRCMPLIHLKVTFVLSFRREPDSIPWLGDSPCSSTTYLGNRVRYFDFARGVFFCLDESLFSTWLNVSIFASTASGLCSVVPKAASSPPSQRDLPRVPSPLVVCFFFAQCEGRRPDSSQCPSTTHHPVYASSAIRDAVEACTQCPWASGSVSRSPFGAAAQASRDRTPSR